MHTPLKAGEVYRPKEIHYGCNVRAHPCGGVWINLIAAEMIGITRQHAHKKARLANEGKPNGWKSIRRVGRKPMYVISLGEIEKMRESASGLT